MKSVNQKVLLPILQKHEVHLSIKREDQLHPIISGNKLRKLKYTILNAQQSGHSKLLTFGGAFSNHIAATAYAGMKAGLQTIGVIRGEELEKKWRENPTLRLAAEHGMQFYFVDRTAYANKTHPEFLKSLEQKFGSHFLVPEGGTNEAAIKGCQEILTLEDQSFDIITTSVGTGGTMAGLIESAQEHQHILGFSALKGNFLKDNIRNFATKENWEIATKYHFGGYAKVNKALILFLNSFKAQTGILLDPIYTGKMVYGILDMVEKKAFKSNTNILAIHTGGLQGIEGMNALLKRKNLPLIDL